jgi:PEGA domain
MNSRLKLGALMTACLFAAALAGPADAQQRQRSGSSVSSGAKASPRSAQGGVRSAGPRGTSQAARPASAGPRATSQGSGQTAGARPAPGTRPPQGGGSSPAARPRPPQAPVTGTAVARPPSRPGSGGYYPGYGYRGHYPYYGYRGYYPYYGYGYYPGWYWGFGAYWGYPSYYGPWGYGAYWGYPYYYDYGPGGSSLKVEVQPKSAEVFVDGYFAGIVDQFDGMFQSLSIEPGEHEITIYQEGYRSIRQKLYLSPGSTMRVKGALEKLAPGEPAEPRPQPAYEPLQAEAQVQQAPQYRDPQPQGPPPGRPAPESYPPPPADSRFGQVAIRVQPAEAEVLIDGEPWRSQPGADRLVVHLAAGTHRVEIRREGFDPFVTAIEIRRGETTVLNVSLSRF